MNSLNLAWYHYVALVLALGCAAALGTIAGIGLRRGWTWMTTRRKEERRFQNVIMHHRRFSR